MFGASDFLPAWQLWSWLERVVAAVLWHNRELAGGVLQALKLQIILDRKLAARFGGTAAVVGRLVHFVNFTLCFSMFLFYLWGDDGGCKTVHTTKLQ